MSINAQGTELYVIDPDDYSVIVIECVTSIDGIDTQVEQIETTCLENTARTYESGLANPGTATFGIQIDPSTAAHVRLHELKTAGTSLKWALGWSNATGTDPTSDTNGNFELGATRHWITFDGFMNSFPFSFAQNTKVSSTIGIQISGDPVLVPATA